MKYLACLLCATAACAQWTAITDVPTFGPKIAGASDGGVWAASADRIVQVAADGSIRSKTTLPIYVEGVAGDAAGNAFVVGVTAQGHGHIVKVEPSGAMIATIPAPGIPHAIALGPAGSLYVAGTADRTFAATPGAYKVNIGQAVCSRPRSLEVFACTDAFVARLNAFGRVEWATLLGGVRNDEARSLALDSDGNAWVGGTTMSADFPTTSGALRSSFGGLITLGPLEYGDGFASKISADGRRLLWSTFVGGAGADSVSTVVKVNGGIVIAGSTESVDFPVSADARQRTWSGPAGGMPNAAPDAFILQLNDNGERVYATYWGDASREWVDAGAFDGSDTVGVSLSGRPGTCMLRYRLSDRQVEESCYRMVARPPFSLVHSGERWIAAGSTLAGLEIPGMQQPHPHLVVAPLGGTGDNTGPAVVGAWNEYFPTRRPVVAAGSIISIYLTNVGQHGPEGTTVMLGSRRLAVLYAAGDQINAAVPSDMPLGLHPLTVGIPFFGTVPVPVDVVPRWPGLYSGALNQDGSVNSESNPARRGEIISLFGIGFGPEPLPVIEPFISPAEPGLSNAQGMQVLFAGRAPGSPDGVYQVNARIPANAQTGRAPVRVVLRLDNGLLLSPLAYVWVR